MSGDVQPRKRKEKKKKKEDGSEEAQQLHHYQHPPQTINDDVNIHVEKEASTGGGVCAKFVFFFLLTALAVLIGLIITEHRELTDLDTVDTESRFSKIFAGWTDNSAHDGDDDHLLDEADFHENDESGEEAESEEDVPSEVSEEIDEDEEEEKDEETEEVQEEEEESAQDDEESENVSQAEEEEEEVEENEEESEETYEEDREASEEEEEEKEEEEEEEVEEQQEEDVDSDESSQPHLDEGEDDGDDNGVDDDDDDDGDKEESEENDDEVAGSEEEIREERDVSEENAATDEVAEDAQTQTSGTGSDSGNTADVADSPLPTPDLSRRNTIVPPPSLEEVEPDMENVEEEYSEEEGEQESDENTGQRPSPTKQKYRELQTTYSRSFTPNADIEQKSKERENYYRDDDDEEYEEDEDEEISENDDDEELLKKLEAKYGKLRRDSNYEDEEDEEEEDEDDEEGEVDDDDFFASWKRVNAPRADESESEKEEEKHSGAQSVYDYANITNTGDYAIKDELDEAHREIHNNTAYALKLFDAILHNHPSSPRALYGRAQALDALAEIKRSNDVLQQAISAYIQTINAPNVPDALFQTAAERCIQRMHFIGRYGQAVSVHQMLINRFPDVVKFRNQLAITYLTINSIEKARRILQETLVKWPNDGVALVHYGFILKTADNKLKEAAYYMRKGIRTRDEGVIDGRFYFHLGDALARLGRKQQAMDIYEEGVKEKVFLSKYQRSLYNVARLTGKPWWRKEETPYSNFYKILEAHWKEIRDEGLAVLNERGYFKDESENLKDVGDWKQFELYARGIRNKENCKKCPVTCQIIANMPDASGCKRGQSKFSVIHPGTHVWPHCGPTNCRLRVHLGLKVPPKTYLRVAEETRNWEEGKVFIFDDSFEHEVWHNGTEFRLVLIVDVWHPELTAMEKKTLTPI